MPTYEFVCKKCRKEFELFVNHVVTEEEKTCPECHGRELEQRFTELLGYNQKSCGADRAGGGFSGFG